MSDQLVSLRKKDRTGAGAEPVSLVPFGAGFRKPHHFAEMLGIAWRNRRHLGYAWRILSRGVCDGCALGTTGLSDWTLDGTHLCLVRLNLLELNTAEPFDPKRLADVSTLPVKRPGKLRALGRLAYPMRRLRGEKGFTRITWDEALSELGARLAAIDPRRLGVYMTSRGITNEVYFAVQKAMRALGTPHIDNAARLCHSPSTAAMKRTMGVGASTCSYKDWYGADVVVFFGSNPANDQPVAMKYLVEAKKLGTKVLVVNTYEEPGMKRYWVPSTPSSALFGSKIADRVYKVTTGGDLAFVCAVQKRLIELGAIDRGFIDAHTSGWDDFVKDLATVDFETLVKQSGASLADVHAFAETIAEAKTGVFVWSMGLTQHVHGAATVEAVCCLGLSKGFVGRDRCGLMPIRGHSGVQGGAEMGAYATAFPGGLAVNEENAEALDAIWGFTPPATKGLDTVSMLRAALKGELDAMYSIGGNFLDTLPQPDQVAEALGKIPLRIHQDIVVTPPMLIEPQEAVYLLPARTRYEHRGGVTETTTERRVVYSPFVPGPEPGEAREEWRIAIDLAIAARPELAARLAYADASEIRDDIAKTIPAYREIATLKKQGDSFQIGGRHLCAGGVFPLPEERARFVFTTPPDRTLGKDQLWLATRRGKQFNSIVQMDADSLTGAERDHLLISEEDIHRLGLRKNQRVRVKSAFGEAFARVFPAPITMGNVQMHWPEANPLIDAERVDPAGRVPDYNAAVTIEPA